MLNASRTFAHDGYSIVLAAVPPMLQRIFKIVGLEQAIPVFVTVEAALNSKTRPGAGKQPPPVP